MVKFIFIILLFVVIVSCNKNENVDCSTYDYSDCITEEPVTGQLNIKISLLGYNAKVPVYVYSGKYGSSSTLVFSDTMTLVDNVVVLPLNQNYYAVAKYNKDNGDVVFAVDGSYFTKKNNTVCDSTCWKLKGNKIDLRLKN